MVGIAQSTHLKQLFIDNRGVQIVTATATKNMRYETVAITFAYVLKNLTYYEESLHSVFEAGACPR